MLRYRLVCGLRNKHLKKKLLSEADFTFTTALNISAAMETGIAFHKAAISETKSVVNVTRRAMLNLHVVSK